jgi:hypothetical protein
MYLPSQKASQPEDLVSQPNLLDLAACAILQSALPIFGWVLKIPQTNNYIDWPIYSPEFS